MTDYGSTKNQSDLKKELLAISVEEYNKEIDEAMKRIKAGKFYTHEQVVELSKKWNS